MSEKIFKSWEIKAIPPLKRLLSHEEYIYGNFPIKAAMKMLFGHESISMAMSQSDHLHEGLHSSKGWEHNIYVYVTQYLPWG